MNTTASIVLPAREKGITVLYDNSCAFCRKWAGRGQVMLASRRIRFEPMINGATAKEMRVVADDGHNYDGAEAVAFLCRQIWLTWPLWLMSRMPGMMLLLRRGYAWVAARRHCLGGACKRGDELSWVGWVPVILFLCVGVALKGRVAPWAYMWMLVAAVFGGFKWLTGWRAREEAEIHPEDTKSTKKESVGVRTLGYLFLWPGMDYRAFLRGDQRGGKGWLWAVGKMVFGAGIFWGVARWVPASLPIVRGWVGLIGLAFLLHFGAMHLLAWVWGVKPIMDAPLRARSVNDFWSRRWNTAFPQLAGPVWFEPMKRWFGAAAATMGVFLISGLLHELVISVPTGGGYGLPTGYFLIQGIGVLIERKATRPAVAPYQRAFAWVVVAGPVFFLFHPLFLQNVVLPMMHAWRAL